MATMTSYRFRGVALAGALAISGVGLAGCAGLRTERQGKEVGQAICELRDASNKDDAQKQLAKIQEDLSDARRITGVEVSQDVRAMSKQLPDLAEHAVQGNDALIGQDLSVLRRNVAQAADATSGNVQRFYQGVGEGLGDCTDG